METHIIPLFEVLTMRYFTSLLLVFVLLPFYVVATKANPPNIIYIIADDLGYGDLSSYGQKLFSTPHIDSLAAHGMKFTQHYSGSTICAPARSALMTGHHTGRTPIRNNRRVDENTSNFPLAPDTLTVVSILQQKGYATGGFGKWGLGSNRNTGDPQKHGFDEFYGHYMQLHAHTHYPTFLYHNGERIELDGKTYSHDLFEEKALDFIRRNKDRPFFCFLPILIPHAAMQVPEEYKAPWREKFPQYEDLVVSYSFAGPVRNPIAALPAMIIRLDDTVGRIIELLDELGIAENTIIMFTSDNGPAAAGANLERPATNTGRLIDIFNSSGPLRGVKTDLYEGGIRVPFLVKWPAKIKPGTVTDHVSAFWDFLPTVCEILGVEAPEGIDGISFLPTLLGTAEAQQVHDYLYWEFHLNGGSRALRVGDWKALQLDVMRNPDSPVELYNLRDDIGEADNLASRYPEKVERFRKMFDEVRVPSPDFPFLPGE